MPLAFLRLLFSKKATVIWLSLPFLLIGLLLAAAGIIPILEHIWPSEQRVAEGRVSSKERENKQHFLYYRFETGDELKEGSAEVPAERWQQLKAGDPIAVRYVVSNPNVNWPDGAKHDWTGDLFMAGLGLAFCSVTVFLWVFQTGEFREGLRQLGSGGQADEHEFAQSVYRTWRKVSAFVILFGLIIGGIVLSELPWIQSGGAAIGAFSDEIAAVGLVVAGLGGLTTVGGIVSFGLVKKAKTSFTGAEFREARRQGRLSRPEWRPILLIFLGLGVLVLGLVGMFSASAPVGLLVLLIMAVPVTAIFRANWGRR